MHGMLVPYSSNVCKNSLVQWNVWIYRLPRENAITMSPVLVGRNFSSVDILLTFTLCQCNVITLLNNLSGTGAWTNHFRRWLRKHDCVKSPLIILGQSPEGRVTGMNKQSIPALDTRPRLKCPHIVIELNDALVYWFGNIRDIFRHYGHKIVI